MSLEDQNAESLKRAVFAGSDNARNLLFLWLTSEPGDAAEYLEVAQALIDVSERNLAHLVVHRGLALFPESEALALFALRLELEARPKAA